MRAVFTVLDEFEMECKSLEFIRTAWHAPARGSRAQPAVFIQAKHWVYVVVCNNDLATVDVMKCSGEIGPYHVSLR